MDENEFSEKVAELVDSVKCGKRCSDYDDECVLVSNPVSCFLGNWNTDGVADGYCPIIHNPN